MLDRVKLGVSPINWINDDTEDLGDFYDVETVLRDMQTLGFAATEMGRKYPRNAELLYPLLGRFNLVLSGAWKTVQCSSGWNPEQDAEEFVNHIAFLKAMKAKYVIVCDGGGSLNWDARGANKRVEKFDEEAWQRIAMGLNRAGHYAREQGITLVYHPHFGTGVETPMEIDRLLSLTDPEAVSLLADTGHIYTGGGDPIEVIRKHMDRIRYFHLKDVRRAVYDRVSKEAIGFIDAIRLGMFTTPGDGCIDFKSLFSFLATTDYQGWMIVEAEQDPLQCEPVQYARSAKDYIEGLW